MSDPLNGQRTSRCPFTFRFPAALLLLGIAMGVLMVVSADTHELPMQLDTPSGDYIHAEFGGRLDKSAAGGGEHTGFEIRANGVTWEVDVSADAALRQAAEQFAGQQVTAKGTFAQRRSVARQRRILIPTTLLPAADQPQEYVRVTMQGTLRAGIMAIGGETTGVTLSASGVTWELDLRQGQRQAAASLDGQTVIASGELRHATGTEIRNRTIVAVHKLERVNPLRSPRDLQAVRVSAIVSGR